MLVDDTIHKQIKKIADLCAAIAAGAKGIVHSEAEAELREATRELVAMDPALADRIDGRSLVRMVMGEEKTEALLLIAVAQADLVRQRGATDAALRRYQRAREMLAEARLGAPRSELWGALEERINSGISSI